MPVVAPAAVARTTDATDELPSGDSVGRISRLVTDSGPKPESTEKSEENDPEAKKRELDAITEHVYQTIRRKLVVERERTRGRV